MHCSPPSFSVYGIHQARILERAAMPRPGDLPKPEIEPTSLMSAALAGGFFSTSRTWEAPLPGSNTPSPVLTNPIICTLKSSSRIQLLITILWFKSLTILAWIITTSLENSLLLFLTSDFPGGSDVKQPDCNEGYQGSIPGSGRSRGERNGNPLQYSCLGNPTDRGAWQTTVHGVAKSWTRLSNFTLNFLFLASSADDTATKVMQLLVTQATPLLWSNPSTAFRAFTPVTFFYWLLTLQTTIHLLFITSGPGTSQLGVASSPQPTEITQTSQSKPAYPALSGPSFGKHNKGSCPRFLLTSSALWHGVMWCTSPGVPHLFSSVKIVGLSIAE